MTNPCNEEADDEEQAAPLPLPGIEGVGDTDCGVGHESFFAARIRTEEHWEVVRAQLFPMFLQRRTLIEIAEAFRISVNTAGAWRSRLIDDLRNEAETMQARDYIMESITSLRLARSEAWKAVLESDNCKDRRAGLHLVAAIENQSTKLGTMIGLFGRAGDRPLSAPQSEHIDDEARQLRSILLDLVSDANGTQDDA